MTDDNGDGNTTTHIFTSATREITERLSKYGLDALPNILAENKSIISGSFPLQCIINEEWPTSDIDIFCKHQLAHECIEKYILSLESSNKIEVTNDKQYSGYHLVTNYKINNNGYEIIIELIVVNEYYVVNHLERDIDIDICRVYFDGNNIFSYTDPSKFYHRQATFDHLRRTYGPKGMDDFLNQDIKDLHAQHRRHKYEIRGFTVEIKTTQDEQDERDDYQYLYINEQIKAPNEAHDLLIKRLYDYKLDGIGELITGYMIATGDFLLNCVLDEHWTNTEMTIYSYASDCFITFFNKCGYAYEYLPIPDVHVFYILDPQYKDESDYKKRADVNYPIIMVYGYPSPDHTTIYNKEGLDLEKICYNETNFYAYIPWEKIQRRIGYIKGDALIIEIYTTKYINREIFITDDKKNMGAIVKFTMKR